MQYCIWGGGLVTVGTVCRVEVCFRVFYCLKVIQKILGSMPSSICHISCFYLEGEMFSDFCVIFCIFVWLNIKFTKIQKIVWLHTSFVSMVLGSTCAKLNASMLNGKYSMNFFRVICLVYLWLNIKFTKIQKSFRWISGIVSIVQGSTSAKFRAFILNGKITNEFFVLFL